MHACSKCPRPLPLNSEMQSSGTQRQAQRRTCSVNHTYFAPHRTALHTPTSSIRPSTPLSSLLFPSLPRNGPRRAPHPRSPTLPHPLDPRLPPCWRMLGPNNALHAPRRPQLRASPAALAHRPKQLVAKEEGAGDMVRGDRGAFTAGVCGAILAECYGECVVFYPDWEGW